MAGLQKVALTHVAYAGVDHDIQARPVRVLAPVDAGRTTVTVHVDGRSPSDMQATNNPRDLRAVNPNKLANRMPVKSVPVKYGSGGIFRHLFNGMFGNRE